MSFQILGILLGKLFLVQYVVYLPLATARLLVINPRIVTRTLALCAMGLTAFGVCYVAR